MTKLWSWSRRSLAFAGLMIVVGLLAACAGPAAPASEEPEAVATAVEDEALAALTVPELPIVALDGRPLRVVATTSLIGHVAQRVGGEAIDLATLMGPGVDPHSYQPAAADLTAAAQADVILINGWDLEEGLVDDLAAIGGDVPLVPVNAGLVPRELGEGVGHDEDDEHESDGDRESDSDHESDSDYDHGPEDPHTWLDVASVRLWSRTLASVFSALDPENATVYQANAEAYDAELAALDAEIRQQLAVIPAERRVLVTNHDAFGYLAEAYGFEVLGTILPANSTTAEPTASDLADLIRAMQAEGVCAVFTETTVSDRLGQTVAAELDACETVQVLSLYSGALGGPGSGAETYVDMMRANAATLVAGLAGG